MCKKCEEMAASYCEIFINVIEGREGEVVNMIKSGGLFSWPLLFVCLVKSGDTCV